jgi:hypothetical protein
MIRGVAIGAAVMAMCAGTAFAHPWTPENGPARDCRTVLDGAVYVGATKMGCEKARRVAKRALRGNEPDGWRCTGVGTPFGHCHGKGPRRGKIAYWAVND